MIFNAAYAREIVPDEAYRGPLEQRRHLLAANENARPFPRGITGPPGPQGPQGPACTVAGSTLPGATATGALTLNSSLSQAWGGTIPSQLNPMALWYFIGPTKTLTLEAGTKVIANSVASLGCYQSTTYNPQFNFDICYKPSVGNPAPFSGGNYLGYYLRCTYTNSQSYSATGIFIPGTTASYIIGPCVFLYNWPVDYNDRVQTTLMVFN